MNEVFRFIELVRREFCDFAEAHGMRERQRSDTMAYRSVLFVGEGAYVRFSLDVRDGYLDASYGDASNLDVYGNVDGTREPARWRGSVEALLQEEGVRIPQDASELYRPGKLVETLRLLIEGIKRNAERVFRSPSTPPKVL